MISHFKNLSIHDLEGEIWLPIIGNEGLYEVSNFGRIKSFWDVKNPKILKQAFSPNGYVFVTLYNRFKERKLRTIHRLVGIHFIPNPLNKPEINHKFGIKTDNRLTQIEWNTLSENKKHAFATGLRKNVFKAMLGKYGKLHHNSKPVAKYTLDGEYICSYEGTRDAERETRICQLSISRAARGIRKTAGGYKWKYE